MQNEFEPIELEPQSKKNRKSALAVIIVLLVIILAIACALLVKYYVITTYIVDGISMYPTLDGGDGPNAEADTEAARTNGEVLYLNKLAEIKRGDIVVFSTPQNSIFSGKSLVKRVIGVAGDRIQIIDNLVYLNGQLLNEPYINEPMTGNVDLDVTIEAGMIFCMGDNRNHSTDCREFGAIPLDDVVGRCFLIKGKNGKLRSCN